MDWYVVDKKYINYLTQFDSRVGYVEYGGTFETPCGNSSYYRRFPLLCPYFLCKTDYVYLLQKEKALIDNVQNTLQNKALKLYQKCIAKPDSSLAARCCNFKMLEKKCSSYSDT